MCLHKVYNIFTCPIIIQRFNSLMYEFHLIIMGVSTFCFLVIVNNIRLMTSYSEWTTRFVYKNVRIRRSTTSLSNWRTRIFVRFWPSNTIKKKKVLLYIFVLIREKTAGATAVGIVVVTAKTIAFGPPTQFIDFIWRVFPLYTVVR